jgi:hypothetical protein
MAYVSLPTRIPVQAVRVEMGCSCGGTMTFTGNAIETFDTSYEHACSKCRREEWLDRRYPFIDYEPSPASARR